MTSATVAVLILFAVGAALLCAALYALFASPSSHAGKKRKQQVVNGFRLAGGLLLGMALMGCLVAGAGEAFGTMKGTRLSVLGRGGAFVLSLGSFTLIAALIQRWAKYFAGFIAWGVLNALIMASSGHLLNNPTIPVSRSRALIVGALCLVAVLVSARFIEHYKLSALDKVALMSWIVAFTWAANIERFTVPAMSVGTGALVTAWFIDRNKFHRHRVVRKHASHTEAVQRDNE